MTLTYVGTLMVSIHLRLIRYSLILVTVVKLRERNSERSSFQRKRHSDSEPFWIFSRSTK